LKKLLFISLNEFKLLFRDRPALLMMVAVPIAVITVIGFALGGIYGKSGDFVKIFLPLVDLDKDSLSKSLIEVLKENKSLDLKEVEYEKAYQLVRDENKAAGAIIIPKGFTTSYLDRKPFTVRILTDPAKGMEVMTIKSFVNASAIKLLIKSLPPQLGLSQVEIKEENLTGIKGNISSFDQNVPGFSIMFIMFGMLVGFSEAIFRERDEDHTFQRLLVAPVSKSSILGGKLLARTVIGMVQMLVLFAFGYFAFDISLGNSLSGLFLTILGVAFSASSIGVLVASLSQSREQARSLGTLTILIMSAMGGCWWPLFIEPKWMQKLSHLVMPAWAMDCFFDLMIRGKEIGDVLPFLGGLYLYGIIMLLVGVKLFKFRVE